MNWAKLRNEYINGNISYRKLAEKHGISESTLMQRASREKWATAREEHRSRIEARTQQKTVEKISEKESDLAADIHSAATLLLKKLNIAIEQTDLYIERTKTKVPKKVQDKKTGEVYTAWQEEENIRLSKKDGINLSAVKQIASALKDLQAIQTTGITDAPIEDTTVSIIFEAATGDDTTDTEDDEE